MQLTLGKLLQLVDAFFFVVVSPEYRVELGESVLVLVYRALKRIVFINECLIVHIHLLHRGRVVRHGAMRARAAHHVVLGKTHLTSRLGCAITGLFILVLNQDW